MSYLGNEFKKIPGLSYTQEFTDAMVHPIFMKSAADGTVEHERLHPDGILTSGDSKIFIILAMSGAFSECSLKTKA